MATDCCTRWAGNNFLQGQVRMKLGIRIEVRWKWKFRDEDEQCPHTGLNLSTTLLYELVNN